MRPLVGRLRSLGIKSVIYLDDGIGTHRDRISAQKQADIARKELANFGWKDQPEKSTWLVVQELTWLGFIINLKNYELSIPSEKLAHAVSLVNFGLSKKYLSARTYAKIAGTIMSLRPVLGNSCLLFTRHLYAEIQATVDSKSWNARFLPSESLIKELCFWVDFLPNSKPKSLHKVHLPPDRVLFSDASAHAGAVCFESLSLKAHCAWNPLERLLSSTWRELRTVEYGLQCFGKMLQHMSVFWYTDNKAVEAIVKKGSMKMHLQDLALSIFTITSHFKIVLNVIWIPREENTKADAISKFWDTDDWSVTDDLFQACSLRWGEFTIDRFANFRNAKLPKFNSRFWNPNTAGVNAFAFDWAGENN
jgi:hypothetical protein